MANKKISRPKKKKKNLRTYSMISCRNILILIVFTFFIASFIVLVRISEAIPGHVFRIKETTGWRAVVYHGTRLADVASRIFESHETSKINHTVANVTNGTTQEKPSIIESAIIYQSASLAQNIIKRYPEYLKLNVKKYNTSIIAVARKSRIRVTNSKIYVGDNVDVMIDLYNEFGNRISSGGDFLRIWLIEDQKQANAAGYITDHLNGSYTGTVKALWEGKPLVKVSIGNTKEHVALYTRYVREYGAYKFTNATFYTVHPKQSESTQCCSTYQQLERRYKGYCNFTEKNFSISFYCGRPKYFECEDWKTYGWDDTMFIDEQDFHIMTKFSNTLIGEVQLTVNKAGEESYVPSPNTSCFLLAKEKSWTAEVPVGYRYMGSWRSLQCSVPIRVLKESYIRCLTQRSLIFIGDSSTRQWFSYLINLLNLKVSDKEFLTTYESRPWQKYVRASSERYGIQIEWMPHENPFSGTPGSDISNLRSVQHKLDQIGPNSTDIVVIHWFLHIARCCDHNSFREHVTKAKHAIVGLLQRSPEIQIFIKGTFSHTYKGEFVPLEYVRRFIEQVLYEEFFDIQTKITYLEGWELTQATENPKLHPPPTIYRIMVHNLMAFACNDSNIGYDKHR